MNDFPILFEWDLDTAGYTAGPEAQAVTPGRRRRITAQDAAPKVLWPRGGPPQQRRPLDKFPHLFLYFAQLELTAQACVDFADRYGPLTRAGNTEGEYLEKWFREIQWMRSAVELATEDLAEAVRRLVGGPGTKLAGVIDLAPPDERAVLGLVPEDLAEAMRLQLLLAVANGWPLQRCARCAKWFESGRGAAATRRSGARFCSDHCRAAHNNAQRTTLEA